MLGILIQIHSILRWIILILLLAAIIKSLGGLMSKRAWAPSDNKISLFLMISAHTQLLVGLVMYFVSPWVKMGVEAIKDNATRNTTRFFTMEHSVMMIIAIALITIGRISGKKAATDAGKFRRSFIYFLIALLVILISIPWPFPVPFIPVQRPWF
ncbi:MAG: cytochrome B [Bacteroidia bacterium]